MLSYLITTKLGKIIQTSKGQVLEFKKENKYEESPDYKEAVENIEEIIQVSDAIMVARGDLAVEIGNPEVPLVQKEIIHEDWHPPVMRQYDASEVSRLFPNFFDETIYSEENNPVPAMSLKPIEIAGIKYVSLLTRAFRSNPLSFHD